MNEIKPVCDNNFCSPCKSALEKFNKSNNVISFILSERLLTITVIGSIFTFQFLAAVKFNAVDPIFDFLFADDNFKNTNFVLRKGHEVTKYDKKISIEFGILFKEFIKWMTIMTILFLCAKYTRFPDDHYGNIMGAAIM